MRKRYKVVDNPLTSHKVVFDTLTNRFICAGSGECCNQLATHLNTLVNNDTTVTDRVICQTIASIKYQNKHNKHIRLGRL